MTGVASIAMLCAAKLLVAIKIAHRVAFPFLTARTSHMSIDRDSKNVSVFKSSDRTPVRTNTPISSSPPGLVHLSRVPHIPGGHIVSPAIILSAVFPLYDGSTARGGITHSFDGQTYNCNRFCISQYVWQSEVEVSGPRRPTAPGDIPREPGGCF